MKLATKNNENGSFIYKGCKILNIVFIYLIIAMEKLRKYRSSTFVDIDIFLEQNTIEREIK